jgi:regulator of protease activity HflC (stomatin/prohibitin superfamily)
VVDAFARYRIKNALRFYQSVGSIQAANIQLTTLLNASLRRMLGEVTFITVVRDQREALMARIRDQLDKEADGYGRAGFRRYWRWKSRRRGGRPPIEAELRALIRQMSTENLLWGAPRIHGELLKLGFEVAQSSVAKYMVKRRGSPSQDGEPSYVTTRQRLPPWICSLSPQLASECSTAS